MGFELVSDFESKGDQPQAIAALVQGIENGEEYQTLLGVTGSGKTFTMAKVVEEVQRPTLVFSHNKTLAAQLYGEFKQFFPHNAVEYFISYYDYYQPEAFIPTTNTYIEKALAINQEIEKLRLSTTMSLMSGRRDVIVVASVSCIYGLADPREYGKHILNLAVGQEIAFIRLLHLLVDMLYGRTETEFVRGTFRVKGEIVDIFPAYADWSYRIYFFGDEIEHIHKIDPETATKLADEKQIALFPANLFVTSREENQRVIYEIQDDLVKQCAYLKGIGKHEEAERLLERTEYDLEMIRELGYCSGIENYSRYFDRRAIGAPPYCLLDYFPDDYLIFVDESHVTMPQIRGMSGGDKARKMNLVEYGFRLPAALDNRPLTATEFEQRANQLIFVSATPTDYEIYKSEGTIVEQIIRPTGLLDPTVSVRPTFNQIDDLTTEIDRTIQRGNRILITTLTKKMAEDLDKYLQDLGFKCRYIHSEIKSLARVEILSELRLGGEEGGIDILVGVNLLREGLDLPEVELVAILDADKEGFLRNVRSLIQTIGRAARNDKGRVIMYADKVTKSMAQAISETERRREKQTVYNHENNITPKTILKTKTDIFSQRRRASKQAEQVKESKTSFNLEGYSLAGLERLREQTFKNMQKAAKNLDFIAAAQLRDQLFELDKLIDLSAD